MMRWILALALLAVVVTARADEPWQPDNWNLFTHYDPARYTQAIATRNNAPAIDRVPRDRLERKYVVPGGLEHATGWRSDLYHWAGGSGDLLRLPVLNQFGHYQYELGWHRTWDEGSVFLDVLTNTATGKVFEVRVAVKGLDQPGRWRRFVDYRDEAQQPPGYRRVKTSECRSCHDDAGSGKYGLGLAPGSDSVFSYPLPFEEVKMRKTAMVAAPLMFSAALMAPAQDPPNHNAEIQRRIAAWNGPVRPQFDTRAAQAAVLEAKRLSVAREARLDAEFDREWFVQQQDKPQQFKRGARKTPLPKIVEALRLRTATVHRVVTTTPAQVTMVPPKLSYLGNDQFGDCVSAETGFSLQAYSVFVGLPEIGVSDSDVISFARNHGYLNGANLLEVIQTMQSSGMSVAADGKTYKAGVPSSVDYTNESVLQNAISQGPVSIAIDANALPSGAGNKTGWSAFGGGNFGNTDHCVSLCGYGPTAAMFKALNTPVPSGAPANGYLLYTWATIGVVDHAWLMGTCQEAWLRTPTVVGIAPGPGPGPGPGPTPGGSAVTIGYPIGSTVRDDGKGTVTITVPSPNPTPPAGSMTLIVGEGVQPGTYTFTPAATGPPKK